VQQQGISKKAEFSISGRPVKQLVENRTLYASHEAELSVYDTFEPARDVLLKADEILYCGMISGRKRLHSEHQLQVDFLPQESFIMAPGEVIAIDFPEASITNPTSCLTLGISKEKLISVCDSLNQEAPLPKSLGEWQPLIGRKFISKRPAVTVAVENSNTLHTLHTKATQQLLLRIVESFLSEHDSDRDLVLKFGVNELLTRIVRKEGREFLLHCARVDPERSDLHAVVHFLDTHLSKHVDIDQLCRIACMSRSKLYSRFKSIVGCGPMEYLQQRRLEEARQLIQSGWSVTKACFEVGYSNASHFTRRFQQKYGLSPREFASRYRRSDDSTDNKAAVD